MSHDHLLCVGDTVFRLGSVPFSHSHTLSDTHPHSLVSHTNNPSTRTLRYHRDTPHSIIGGLARPNSHSPHRRHRPGRRRRTFVNDHPPAASATQSRSVFDIYFSLGFRHAPRVSHLTKTHQKRGSTTPPPLPPTSTAFIDHARRNVTPPSAQRRPGGRCCQTGPRPTNVTGRQCHHRRCLG